MAGTRARWVLVLAVAVATGGCTTLRELPRSTFDARPERKAVRVETRDRLIYEFDYAAFEADTLTGYRNRPEIEGPVDQMMQFRIPYDEVEHLFTRSVDWRRTGLVSGGIVGSALWVGLRATNASNGGGNTSGGGKTPIP